MKKVKVLVSGGRDFDDMELMFHVLDEINERYKIKKIIQGFAKGADRLAHVWARQRKVKSTYKKYQVTDVMWKKQGKKAGHLRNKKMLDEESPDLVLCFPTGGPGTKNMIKQCKEGGYNYLIVRRNDYNVEI